MPIRPENIARYPKNWKEIREKILTRAGQVRDESGKVIQEACCEWCGSENHGYHYQTCAKVVLTIAHMDHTPENCDDDNLKCLCARCHNGYDAQMRADGRKARKLNKLKDKL